MIFTLWEFFLAHPLFAILVVSVGFISGLANLRIGREGYPEVALVSVAIVFLLNGWIGFSAGSQVGFKTVPVSSRDPAETEPTRNVSGAERWNRAVSYGDGTFFLAPLGLGLCCIYVRYQKDKLKKLAEREYFDSEESSSDRRKPLFRSQLDHFKMGAGMAGTVAVFFIYIALQKP